MQNENERKEEEEVERCKICSYNAVEDEDEVQM